MNKILTLLIATMFITTMFAVGISADSEEELSKQVNLEKLVSVHIGYIVNEDRSDATYIRVFTKKVNRRPLLSPELLEQIRQIREDNELDAETMKQRIRDLVQEYKNTDQVSNIYGGKLVIGKGEDHENYWIVSKEVTENTATFYVLPVAELSDKTHRRSFFRSIGMKIGLLKEDKSQAADISDVDVSEAEFIGELTVTKEGFDTINIWTGTLTLEETKYQGTWSVNAFSALKFWVPSVDKQPQVVQQANAVEGRNPITIEGSNPSIVDTESEKSIAIDTTNIRKQEKQFF